MKIVVIGGTGSIGSKVVEKLKQKGHEAIAAAPNTGVNTITGEGLKEAMAGAQVVIDLANSPSFEDKAVLEFFETSGRNLLAAEAAAGVRHHVAQSIVGTDRTDNGYFRAKVAQEKLIETSGTIVTMHTHSSTSCKVRLSCRCGAARRSPLVPGQTFYEGPNDVHTVGRNASTTEPAKFIVILLKKKGVDVVLPAE
jgi:hypothetical protein